MMDKKMKQAIVRIYEESKINMLDIPAVQRYALEKKMYDIVVYINNNLTDYVTFVKIISKK